MGVHQSDRCKLAVAERERDEARAIIAAHNLCHDLHGKVGPREFADGCAAEQRKLYGCAPDADRVAAMSNALKEAEFFINHCGCERDIAKATVCVIIDAAIALGEKRIAGTK